MNTILGKKQENKEELNKQKEQISAVLREDEQEISMKKSLVISTFAHPLSIIFSWLFLKILIFLLALLGIVLPLFNKPEPKVKDIEFIIVNKPEKPPINKNTKYRSDRNSRAGGKHDPKRKIADPEPVASSSKQQKPAQPQKKAATKTMPKPMAIPKPMAKAPKVPPRPVPSRRPSAPRVRPPSPFSVPVPIAKSPKVPDPRIGGPITAGPIGQSAPSSEPAPIMSAGGYNSLRRSPSYSMSSGTPGNPSPGNPNGRPGVDALKEPDFGPWMRELTRAIKRRWNPPKEDESKRVVLLFKISKDGRLLSIKIDQSSGNPNSDQAAIYAVKAAAPFRPLPPEHKDDYVNIHFKFDYNVFGVGCDLK